MRRHLIVFAAPAVLALSPVFAGGTPIKAAGSKASEGRGVPAYYTARARFNQDGEQQKRPDRSKALKKFLEAQELDRAGNYAGAVTAYKEAIELDPESAELKVALGTLYLTHRNVIDAEAQAREALDGDPENLEASKLLARVYLAQSFVGTSVDRVKARAAIERLEQVVKKGQKVMIEVGGQDLPALAVIGQLHLALDEEEKALEAFKRLSDSDSGSDRAHFLLAELYYQRSKIREAAAAARKAYDISPQRPEYASLLAKLLLRMGRTQEALDIYKKAMGVQQPGANDEEDGVAMPPSGLMFDYAEALVSSGRYDEATKLVDPIIKTQPKNSRAFLTATKIATDALRRSGKREEAARTLEETLKGQDVSESLELLYALAETYEEMQKFDRAIATYEEALKAIVNPDGTVGDRSRDRQNAGLILQRVGMAYRMADQRDKARETFERMREVLGSDSPRPDQLIVDTLLNEGRNKEALHVATTAAERFPEERSFKLAMGQATARLGDIDGAEAAIRPLLDGGAGDADIYLFLSGVQLEANYLDRAEQSVRKAVSLEPDNIGPLVTLSIVQDRQKRFKESESTLRKALAIDPDNATVLNNLGYFLAERGERMKEAEELIRRAVNIDPINGSYLDSLGWVLFKQGKLEEARRYLEQAVVYSRRSATVHDHLGDLYKKFGEIDKARAHWEEALKLSTEPGEIKSVKEKLKKR